ncbi:DUF5071 domain-containing protein [Mesorhizobium sp. B3-2-1]|uniref:DUF5071 domain-containing protein n=1 Tax=Mesorhizobium sp. B3-2-1 TaxID=2589891 RepID=UPI001125FA51|nr:DUF5071 domain-containing protein [Mesorhizobium sp. B3-2-1]TPI30298.1 DUF5071 domain-containing protein [Mesorhizobium sp. B3-2-1]
MIDVKSLVPRDKFDLDAVTAVERAGYPAIAPILDDLIGWTADGNWPVAQPLAHFLSTLGEPIVDPVLRVLRGDDPTFKYFCIIMIVEILPINILKAVEDDLRRLADSPNKSDRMEEVDEVAREALLRLRP